MRHFPFAPTRRDALRLAGAACAAAALPGSARPAFAEAPAILSGAPSTTAIGGAAFGTRWHVALPAGVVTAPARRRIEAALARIDALMSPWREDSEISRVNAAPAGWHRLAPETWRVTGAALAVAEASGGAFDPTVGPLVARWGFGPIAGAVGSWRGLALRDGEIRKEEAGLTVDLCGIAKGHALDMMAAALEETGHAAFLADLGGEFVARGRHPSGRVWRVGVEDPRPGAPGLAAMLELDGRAVATSGRRANGYTFGARRYSHIIDPERRAPVAGRLASVSVVAPEAMEADAWATALMATGAAGVGRARALSLPALFAFDEDEGLRVVATGGLETAAG